MSMRITSTAAIALADLHHAVAALRAAGDKRMAATLACNTAGAWSTDPAWLAMESAEANCLAAEMRVVEVAAQLVAATRLQQIAAAE